jgi:hypothetical protein
MRCYKKKYVNTGFTYTPLKHWKRRMNRDLKKLEAA